MQWRLLSGAIVAVALSCGAVWAESASTLLEQGVYYQETAGNLDAAIQAYQKVAGDAEANRPAVAEALYRMGVCQMKKKQVSEAAETFDKLISQYSDQGSQVAKAKERLAELAAPARQQAIEAIFANPEPIVKIANAIFDAIRKADYDRWLNGEGWQSFPLVRYYQTNQWYDALVPWICKTFKADPIRDVALGQVFKNEDGLPAIPYKLTLTSGKVMEGTLPFNLNQNGEWYARWGLDWHLGKRMRLTEARKAVAASSAPAKVQMRAIGKVVSLFAEGDLSTPESAAASYYRASGRMDAAALAAVSVSPVDPDMFKGMQKQMNPQELETWNKSQLTAIVIQVLSYRDNLAMVITKLNFPPGVGRSPFSGRQFGLIDGKWKNMGEDRYPTPGAAQAAFEKHKDAAWEDYERMAE